MKWVHCPHTDGQRFCESVCDHAKSSNSHNHNDSKKSTEVGNELFEHKLQSFDELSDPFLIHQPHYPQMLSAPGVWIKVLCTVLASQKVQSWPSTDCDDPRLTLPAWQHLHQQLWHTWVSIKDVADGKEAACQFLSASFHLTTWDLFLHVCNCLPLLFGQMYPTMNKC